jgi:hypothetical protein
LYDSLLKETVEVLRTTVSIAGTDKVTFADLNDRPLIFPPLVFPLRRGFARHAKSAYEIAMNSSRSHLVAELSMPSEEQWEELWEYC